MIATMAANGYWKSPGSKTRHGTLYSAILREIETKGTEAPFQEVGSRDVRAAILTERQKP